MPKSVVGEVQWFCDIAEMFRQAASLVARGKGQPPSAQPTLEEFADFAFNVNRERVEELADTVAWIARQSVTASLAGSDVADKVSRLAAELKEVAPEMAEWDSYEPPENAPGLTWGIEQPDPGTGYSTAAARAFADVEKLTTQIMRILADAWEYRPMQPYTRH